MSARQPELSIVIPVYDNWWLTARCLRELDRLRSQSSVTFEVIVVDNASTDETPEAIAGFPWVRYQRFEANRNFAGGCNAGVRLAEAPLTLLLNNDAYPVGDALTPLIRAFDRPEVTLAGGALFFEDGVTQAAGLVLLPNAHWHYFYRNLTPALDAVNRSRDALAISGAAMALRTQWFLENGGFDESFVNGFEDVDLCLRAREQGRAIVYVAEARFIHYEAASAGRFDRESENERRFYGRWSATLGSLPRTGRGQVGAVIVRTASHSNALLEAALNDLEEALRAFGHPVVRREVPWRPFDRRFRHAAGLGWFTNEVTPPGIAIACHDGALASIRTFGAATLEVPWLPCAAVARVQALAIRRSDDPSCTVVGIVGDATARGAFELDFPSFSTLQITPQMLLGNRPYEFSCIVHLGLTDESAFGNILLAQAGLPAVVLARDELRALFPADVGLITEGPAIPASVARFVADPAARVRYGDLVAADARRRFSPRRSAIRVVDLLAAARFGLERPAAVRGNTPL